MRHTLYSLVKDRRSSRYAMLDRSTTERRCQPSLRS